MKKDVQWTPAAARGLAEGVKTGNFQNFLDAATPGGIEASEARGQAAFVASETMPIDLKPSLEKWEAVGFRFGSRLEGKDSIFRQAQMPKGWTKAPTEHSMWSVLLDGNRSLRGKIFFKAASYDYKSHGSLTTRYAVENVYPDHDRYAPEEPREMVVADHAVPWAPNRRQDPHQVVRSFGKVVGWEAQDDLYKQGLAWLKRNYPDFESVEAYW